MDRGRLEALFSSAESVGGGKRLAVMRRVTIQIAINLDPYITVAIVTKLPRSREGSNGPRRSI